MVVLQVRMALGNPKAIRSCRMCDFKPKLSQSKMARKYKRKYGKDVYKIHGLMGWEKRKDLMLERIGKYTAIDKHSIV